VATPNISNTNIGVFTELPHAQMTVERIVDRVRNARLFPQFADVRDLDWAGAVVLDAGCGAGMKCLPLALVGAEVVGIDGSPAQASRAKAAAEALGVDAEFLVGRLENLSDLWGDRDQADLIINSAVIHHVDGWRDVIAQFEQILKPGGWLYLTWGDPSLSLCGFILKNQIAYRLGWNMRSRLKIGRALFGWWDRRRNTMDVELDSFFADLYAAYYNPIPLRTMLHELDRANFRIAGSMPPFNLQQWLARTKHNKWFLAHLGLIGDAVVRWRYFFRFRHGPRVLLCQRVKNH